MITWKAGAQQEDGHKMILGAYLDSVEAFRLTPDELKLLPKDARLKVEAMQSKYLITVESAMLKMTIDEDGQLLRTEKK